MVSVEMPPGCARVLRVFTPVPPAVERAYAQRVLPALVALVAEWWGAYDGSDRAAWLVRADATAGGVFVAAPDDDTQDAICCPCELNDATLLIGWQQYRNPAICDPKCALAERLITAVLASDELAPHVDIEEMDDIAEDIGLYQRVRGYVSEDDEERAREEREDAEEEEEERALLEEAQMGLDDDDDGGLAEESRRRRRRQEVRYHDVTALGNAKQSSESECDGCHEDDANMSPVAVAGTSSDGAAEPSLERV